jgi:hypothetical protein
MGPGLPGPAGARVRGSVSEVDRERTLGIVTV